MPEEEGKRMKPFLSKRPAQGRHRLTLVRMTSIDNENYEDLKNCYSLHRLLELRATSNMLKNQAIGMKLLLATVQDNHTLDHCTRITQVA